MAACFRDHSRETAFNYDPRELCLRNPRLIFTVPRNVPDRKTGALSMSLRHASTARLVCFSLLATSALWGLGANGALAARQEACRRGHARPAASADPAQTRRSRRAARTRFRRVMAACGLARFRDDALSRQRRRGDFSASNNPAPAVFK